MTESRLCKILDAAGNYGKFGAIGYGFYELLQKDFDLTKVWTAAGIYLAFYAVSPLLSNGIKGSIEIYEEIKTKKK